MSTPSQPELPSSTPRGPDRPGVAIRTSSSNYVTALNSSAASSTTKVPIPDGRKDSSGEPLASPTETWKPDLARRQSYKMDDLKREMQMKASVVEGDEGKEGTSGFTEK